MSAAARLAALLSFRTISGKLIIGLVVLLGVASIIVSVVTAESLSNSLMSSLDQQLQAASMRWHYCLYPQQGGETDAYVDRPPPACPGQGSGTFEAELTGSTFSNVTLVSGQCHLSPADEKTLLALHTSQPPPAVRGGPGGPQGPLFQPLAAQPLAPGPIKASVRHDEPLLFMRGEEVSGRKGLSDRG